MSGVALVGIVHDTEARYLPVLARDLPPLREHYAAISAICGPWTAPATIDALRAEGGVNVIVDETIPVNARPYALNLIATQRTWTHVHLTDLDHALHWARCWPEELDTVNAEIAAHDFLLLGRTPRATAT